MHKFMRLNFVFSLTYADKEECGDLRAQLSDVVTRCRSTLASYGDQSKLAALPSRLTDLCAAMLLNLEDLTYFISGMFIRCCL